MGNKSYPSASKVFTPGQPLQFAPWVPVQGGSGRANVIDKIVVEITYDLGVAVAALLNENLPNFLSNIVVNDHAGVRRNLSGVAQRIANMKTQKVQNIPDIPDIGVAANALGTYRLEIPFAIERSVDAGKEFTIRAELMRQISLTCGTGAALSWGASAVTINSASILLRAYCHEEARATLKARDLVTEAVMETTTESRQKVGPNGGFVDWILAYKNGDSLSSMAGWTSHLVRPMHELEESAEQKIYDYISDSGAAGYIDPIQQSKVRVVYSTSGHAPKLHDHFATKEFSVKAANSVASVMLLQRSIQPRSAEADAGVIALYGQPTRVKSGPGGIRSSQFLEVEL